MIYFKAKEFRSKYKINSKSSLEYLKMIIHKSGHNLLTYSDEIIKLTALNFREKVNNAPALSLMDDKGNITVYYNDELPMSVQRLALCHELGHIELGHFYLKTIGEKQEKEADKFADYLLSPKNDNKLTWIQIVCSFLCILFCILTLSKEHTKNINNTKSNTTIPKTVSETTANVITDSTICYYAQYSVVYHLYKDCYYLKNSEKIYTDTVESCGKDRLCSACEHRRNS